MRIALAQVPHPMSFGAGMEAVRKGIAAAAAARARLVCFPECCLKGMRGTGFPVEALTREEHDLALAQVREEAAAHRIHVVLPTERPEDGACQNVAYVVRADGAVQGYQTKNQIPLEEETLFEPGLTRRLFQTDELRVGVVICHEGWRYPETVRWAAARGASLVLHPNFCGGPGTPGDPPARGMSFYEKAMACRAGENHVFFASVNFALPVQECATALMSPDGECVATGPLHDEALVVADVDPAAATGYLARRFAPDRYREEPAG
ncbi:MAG TPA: carbon-nitrogen hydrolase family protein [Vicinamibacteria bacterium]|nr:carbon-nitrogen hydrolase family protein [Vicinamibacteria bacterium]